MSTLNEDERHAPDEPWPFPPTHVMPTEANGTEAGYWHCVRCGAVLKHPTVGLMRSMNRCPEYNTLGRQRAGALNFHTPTGRNFTPVRQR